MKTTRQIDPFGLKLVFGPGNDADIDQLKKALKAVEKTAHGKAMCKRLRESPKTFMICPTHNNGALFDPITGIIAIDPNFRLPIKTISGTIPASTARTLAHELGHACGDKDTGPGKMDNVIRNKNPVAIEMGELGRIKY